jgi:DNA mismatch repair protein MutS
LAKKEKEDGKTTPLMQQYLRVKAKYPDAILLFRVGDFYETFGEDAVKTAGILGIVLTKRNNGGSDVELAGFPHHSMDLYMPRLVKAGYRVAICEQLEKPDPQKKIVRRGVTEVITPGVSTDDKLLDHKSNNYLAALYFGARNKAGVSFLDISTGEFLVSEGELSYIDKLMQSLQPAEVLFSKKESAFFATTFGEKWYTYPIDDWAFQQDFAREKLLKHFQVLNLKGFGIDALELAQIASGAILHYLETTENKQLQHLTRISRIFPEHYVWLDRFTIRNLELLQSNHDGGTSLLQVLDETISPMGSRLLRKWVALPLLSQQRIEARLDTVAHLIDHEDTGVEVAALLRQIGDIERLLARVPAGKINPRELKQLKRALDAIAPLKNLLLECDNEGLIRKGEGLNPCISLRDKLEKELVEDPPVNVAKGGVIASGVSPELDELRHLVSNSKQVLVDIQQAEILRTGISSLKIGFNSVFGYYLEVTHKYKNQVPDTWIRKQTLTNAERYVTEELKELEARILGAEEKMLQLEEICFQKIVAAVFDFIEPIQFNAQVIAELDCLLSFAVVAKKYQYTKPQLDDSHVIDIQQGRHPVIERHLPLGEQYIPNDVWLDNAEQQIMMITGPNMSGKSALLRQTALICLMAQMGSFVPAANARLGIIDKVFTRVGASDNISSGESTFMVEMNETASIMNNMSDRSLILLDEIGRGTSTYDGISIAWSIAEFLHNNGQTRPKTLFATHYHELNELAGQLPRIKNFHVATREIDQKIIFLRTLVSGGSEHSFGIQVAKMAGMPKNIVDRATQILGELEKKSIGQEESAPQPGRSGKQKTVSIEVPNYQLSIFDMPDPVLETIRQQLLDMDLNSLTPIDCLYKLRALQLMISPEKN